MTKTLIETYLGTIHGVVVSVISGSDNTQENIIESTVNDFDEEGLKYICRSTKYLDKDGLDDSKIKMLFNLPGINRYGKVEYYTEIESELFPVIYYGLVSGFYDRIVLDMKYHYLEDKYFSYGFHIATENYKKIYQEGELTRQWGVGLINELD